MPAGDGPEAGTAGSPSPLCPCPEAALAEGLADMYALAVLGRGLKSRGPRATLPQEALGEGPSCFSQLLVAPDGSELEAVSSVCSVFTRPLPLCLSPFSLKETQLVGLTAHPNPDGRV